MGTRSLYAAASCWAVLCGGLLVGAEPPLCTTHFFDWYVVSDARPLEQWQRQWTYRVDWGALGIAPHEIGQSEHYYESQFRKIREAGFDGAHYEWHQNDPKPQFLAAAATVGLPLAMFYDMEIRFNGRTAFITPTDGFAREAVGDVLRFYRAVPKSLWLRDRRGRLPIVVYGYAFDQSVNDPARWDAFYRALIDGVQRGLGERVVFHWTNTSAPQQMYGFQHFPEIQSYIFNEANGQTQVNARSVTFVVHYDDLGVSFQRQGPRAQRWIRNDIRYLQESLWLALHTNPDLVFNYGWNELFEGEHLLPDDRWGSWRYDVAAAMVRAIKTRTREDLPRALIIVDDFLPALRAAPPEQAAPLRREMELLTRLRGFVPQAEVVLSGSGRDLAQYPLVFSLNVAKRADEERALAASPRCVVYASPAGTADSPMLRQFTTRPLRPLAYPNLGPANEFVVAQRGLDVDLTKYPRLAFRCRNAPGTLFHIRCAGRDREGQEVPIWSENSPTDDRRTEGQWSEQQVDLARIAREAAGREITRVTRIELILDDLNENGEFTLDVDWLRLLDAEGRVGWREEFASVADWTAGASFSGVSGAAGRYHLAAVGEDGLSLGRVTLKAVVLEAPSGPVDEATRMIAVREGTEVLHAVDFNGARVPMVLRRGSAYFLNTYTPSEESWAACMPRVLGQPLHRGVLFHSTSCAVTAAGVTRSSQERWGVIREEPLPLDRVRLVAPPELDQACRFCLPHGPTAWSVEILRGSRATIPLPDAGSAPPGITLQPGEVVELRPRGEENR